MAAFTTLNNIHCNNACDMIVLLNFTRLSNKAIIYCISKCTVCQFVLIRIRNKGEVGHVRAHVSINDSDFVIFARVYFTKLRICEVS